MNTPDIVARLRDWRSLHLTRLGELFDEAADEIERLRLTDEERQAVRFCALVLGIRGRKGGDTLRGLLERMT